MVSIENVQKYQWGENCFGWHLVKTPELGIIQEIMPPGAEEKKHIHEKSNQFFFILKGEATFQIDERIEIIKEQEGIYIEAGKIHQIKNLTNNILKFLVISQPHSHSDRQNIFKY